VKEIMRNATHHFLSEKERDTILSAIKSAEAKTSGEIRIFIESRCKWTDTIRRAEEIFIQLKMTKTEFQNAVLIYIAYKDREFAIFGDKGCVIKFTKSFWKNTKNRRGISKTRKFYRVLCLSKVRIYSR
jgi:uncharacterized membrane protein